MELKSFTITDIKTSLEREGVRIEVRGSADLVVTHLKNIELADSGSLTFYIGTDPTKLDHLNHCALICPSGISPRNSEVVCLHTEDPKLAFYIAAQHFVPERPAPGVHPTAIIHPLAKIHPTATVGAYCVLDECVVGEEAVIHSHVRIYPRSVIGNRVIIESGSRIGATGQVWAWDKRGKQWIMPQFGGTIIGDNCFIGANVTIVSGTLQDTVISKNCRITHGSTIGHNCFFGEGTFLSSSVAIGGSVTTGENCFFGCGARVRPGVKLANNIVVGVGSVVVSDFDEDNLLLAGVPAKVIRKVQPEARLAGVPQNPKWAGNCPNEMLKRKNE